jgi:hypothetical protein
MFCSIKNLASSGGDARSETWRRVAAFAVEKFQQKKLKRRTDGAKVHSLSPNRYAFTFGGFG